MDSKLIGAPRRGPGLGGCIAATVVASLISSAHAQTTPAPVAAPASSSTPAPAPAPEPAEDKDAKQPVKPSVVISGYRSSLALSANEKRENIGLSDTVFSEDIGKFPDPNIADALARVPGVTVRRAEIDGEGLNLSLIHI